MKRKFRIVAAMLATLLLLVHLSWQPAVHAATGQYQVADAFREYYAAHQGLRVLGAPLTGLLTVGGYPAQYFEKGRIEDHRGEVDDPNWAFMYGRLTAELLATEAQQDQSVNATSSTYAELRHAADPIYRQQPPDGFTAGTQATNDGMFVPYDPRLRAAQGYIVPQYFWDYINQESLFPGGWLHDIGLPMTNAFVVDTVKNGETRQIMMQAFERTILTYDPLNPPAWQVERGNIGADLLRTASSLGSIELPAAGARVTLPLHILARVGQPGEEMRVALHWHDGVTLEQPVTVLEGENGQGLLISNLDWRTESRPPQSTVRAATVEIRTAQGALVARQPVTVLRWNDPQAQRVTVYWLLGNRLHPTQRAIPRTVQIGTAAIKELLWGPRSGNLAGFQTALPTPQEVLDYPGREADWGPRVTLNKLVINDGVATADFSQEMRAYGGNFERAIQIREQIRRTLEQFRSVDTVRITIDGQTDPLLQP